MSQEGRNQSEAIMFKFSYKISLIFSGIEHLQLWLEPGKMPQVLCATEEPFENESSKLNIKILI